MHYRRTVTFWKSGGCQRLLGPLAFKDTLDRINLVFSDIQK